MTTQRLKRCKHCKNPYFYFSSGFHPRHNDDRYCPDCHKIIEEALSTVPVKFKKTFIKTEDYTREQIIEAQKNKHPLSIRRILPGLFDLKDPSNKHNNVCEEMLDPTTKKIVLYSASWWSKNPSETEVKKQVWWDNEKNSLSIDQEDYN